MKIVCDYTGVVLDAATEVAEALVGRGFSSLEAFPAPPARTSGSDGKEGGDSTPEPAELSLLAHDDGAPSDGGREPEGQEPPSSDPFEGWENTREFLKARGIADLRAYAAENGVELPRPANKGQIVNAIAEALGV